MTDTAEYWSEVKSFRPRVFITHLKGADCGHFHKYESAKLVEVNCNSCRSLINDSDIMLEQLEKETFLLKEKIDREHRKKKGYRLKSIIKFGKYKGNQKTIQWVIDNDSSYFRWMIGKFLFHPELDTIVKNLK